MRRSSSSRGKKERVGQKKQFKSKKQTNPRDEQEILSEESNLAQPQFQQNKQQIYSKYESAEDLRKRLAKQALSKAANAKNGKIEPFTKKIDDDFFISDPKEYQQQNKKVDQAEYDEMVTERFKMDYLRKGGKLYEQYDQQFSKLQIQEPVEYRGHTKCITGIELTNTNMYSCSKDRSIIKWDRQTMKKEFISLGKDENHHKSDILCLSLHSNENVLATAGEDYMIKLWDVRANSLVQTLKGHKNQINGLKFGTDSNNICSISSDLTLKQWDFAQRGLIQTFFEHNSEVLDIDCFNGDDFLTSGDDHQIIAWKTQKQTKIVFKGHEYAIDRVRAINHQKFVSASQDGSVNLWYIKKTKPAFKFPLAHESGWINALANIKQTNIFATGAIDRKIKIWAIEGELRGINLVKQLEMKGIVTDLKITPNYIAATECDEHRLGRWVTDKCRNKIKVFRIRSALPQQ